MAQDPADATTIAALRQQVEVLQAETENLKTALAAARTIGAAIGITMVNHKIPEMQAFEMLAVISQQTNRKIRDIATELVFSGTIAYVG